MHNSEQKERKYLRVVQKGNLRGLLGIRRIARIPSAWFRVVWGREKGGVSEKISESYYCFGHRNRAKNVN